MSEPGLLAWVIDDDESVRWVLEQALSQAHIGVSCFASAAEFLEAHSYKNVLRWASQLARRPAVQRGRMVNRTWGELARQLHERHDASDFDLRTENKLHPEQGD